MRHEPTFLNSEVNHIMQAGLSKPQTPSIKKVNEIPWRKINIFFEKKLVKVWSFGFQYLMNFTSKVTLDMAFFNL